MHKADRVRAELLQSDIVLAGEIAEAPDENGPLYAFVTVSRSPEGYQRPTNHTLNQIAARLKTDNIEVYFVLVEQGVDDIQASLKTTLFRFFPEVVGDAFLSTGEFGPTVWVSPKVALSEQQFREISDRAKAFLDAVGIPNADVRSTAEGKVPTATAILTTLRRCAPATLTQLSRELEGRGFSVPNETWLSHALDKLRKSDTLIRDKSETYSLTLAGLVALGSAKSRRSPDVERALAMRRARV